MLAGSDVVAISEVATHKKRWRSRDIASQNVAETAGFVPILVFRRDTIPDSCDIVPSPFQRR